MAEIFGRANGVCRAKGGSMHIADFSQNILGANGIVAAGAPIAVGAALSAKKRGTDQVVLCFFGDGAIASGPTHESMNFAALWKLPVIFVRQNNQYAESTPRSEYQGMPDVVVWAQGYGTPATRVDGNDVLAVYEATKESVERARRREGPSFIESETYRWYGHNIGDPGTWRPKEEVEAWKAKDPIPRFCKVIVENGVATETDLEVIEAEEEARLQAAIQAAEAAPRPDLKTALEDLYVDPVLGLQAIRGVRL
jgi:pyruvate dehydrogenase E1 component alpha subunit